MLQVVYGRPFYRDPLQRLCFLLPHFQSVRTQATRNESRRNDSPHSVLVLFEQEKHPNLVE